MEKRELLREATRRPLDDAAKERRQRKTLSLLEQDNHIEEPHSDVKGTKRPQFGDEDEDISANNKRRKKKRISNIRARCRKTFEILLDEEYQATKGGTTGTSGRRIFLLYGRPRNSNLPNTINYAYLLHFAQIDRIRSSLSSRRAWYWLLLSGHSL
ncbi:unnamed protein product [Schistosoma intercalatum]|nr:unnamed protein product [Schistosoma intercalatum]CAH8467234.1 unnamed protein product [Schistosoma intercalatum]